MGAQCYELVKSSVPSIYDSYEKAKISSRPRTKVRHHRPPGSARAKACMFDMHQSWNSKSSTSILGGGTPQQLTITCAQWVGNLTFPWVGWGIWTASFKLNFLTQSSVWQHSLIDFSYKDGKRWKKFRYYFVGYDHRNNYINANGT